MPSALLGRLGVASVVAFVVGTIAPESSLIPTFLPTGIGVALAIAVLGTTAWRRWRGGQVADFSTLLKAAAESEDRLIAENERLKEELTDLRREVKQVRDSNNDLYDLTELYRRALIRAGLEVPTL